MTISSGANAEVAFIAVHAGAGVLSTTHEKEIKRALRKACTKGLSTLREMSMSSVDPESSNVSNTVGRSTLDTNKSLDMAIRAISVLEDDEFLNAGYGSNLTIEGTVECDASAMISTPVGPPHFGSVGAVSGIRNPIRLAEAILLHTIVPDKLLGRVPPLTLVSSGAEKFAQGLEKVANEDLISARALEQWRRWTKRLEDAQNPSATKGTFFEDTMDTLRDIQDTVGAVAFHPRHGVASGVSSGGLLLKHPGRIGEAAVYGAGCWASQITQPSVYSACGCSVSGTGEYIIRNNIARRLGEALSGSQDIDPHDTLNDLLVDFWNESTNREIGEERPSLGILMLLAAAENSSVRLLCGFTTASMGIGYASTKYDKPKASRNFVGR